MLDLRPERIEAAVGWIDPVFRGTPQFVDEQLAGVLGREVVVKVETLNPIGSFKARGASVLVRHLDPARTWVCSTAGNFGQALAYLGRQCGADVDAFVAEGVPSFKIDGMRALGARVEVCAHPETASREHAAASDGRLLVVDGRDPAMAEGAGTIGVELARLGPFETVVVQVGDGALISGVACWLKSVAPQTRIVGVCASGAPAMAHSFAAGRAIALQGEGTIATALAVTEPVPESVARLIGLVDEIVLVDDGDLRRATELIADCVGVLVEPAGAAGVAALLRHGDRLPGERAAVILTGTGAHPPRTNACVSTRCERSPYRSSAPRSSGSGRRSTPTVARRGDEERTVSELRVRRAREGDAAGLVELLAQLHSGYPGDSAQVAELVPLILRSRGRTLLVAELNGELVGTADVVIVPNITHGGRPWAIVETVVVDASTRGSGVGTALLSETLRLAREAGCYMVQLLSLNHRLEAHAFYRRLGFEPVAAGFRLYRDGFAPTTGGDERTA